MFDVLSQINWVGVLAATVVSQIIGALWFTAVFGMVYAKALGREGQPVAMAPIFIVGPLVCNFITVVAAAIVMRALGITTLSDALVFGLIAGFGFLATTTVNTGINPNMPRPLLYGLVSGSYFLVAGVVISLVLGLIQ